MQILAIELIKMSFSKKRLLTILRYLVLSLCFYPFLSAEESKNKKSSKPDAEASTVGDDIYPLF